MRLDCRFLLRAARGALVGACLLDPAPLFAQTPLVAPSPSWEWPGTPGDLIRAVTQGTFQAMVRDFKAAYGIERLPSVKVTNQCARTAYDAKTATVCISPGMIQGLSRIGDGALAYVVAHELAHHLQHSIPALTRGLSSRTQLELQADCLAGLFLARNRQVSFSEADVVEALNAASKLGDRTYDHFDHHGTGEMRQLAIRSGVRYGLTNKRDNYFPLFCGLSGPSGVNTPAGLNTRGAENGVGR